VGLNTNLKNKTNCSHGRDVWKPLYAHVFRAFDGLWRFQQTHRAALLAQGLERWEIGDVAAKIGQLYFFAYLLSTRYVFFSTWTTAT
jgi:hypothetical protein